MRTCTTHPISAAVVALLAAAFVIVMSPRALGQGQAPVAVSAVADRTGVRPGDQFVIAVIFDHAEGWHIHTNNPVVPPTWRGFVAIPTEIEVAPSSQYTAGPIQWPMVHELPLDLGGTGRPVNYGVFEGQAIAYVPITVAPGASGPVTVSLEVRYQACNDRTCVFPEAASLTIEQPMLKPGEATAPTGTPEVFAGFDISSLAAAAPAGARGGDRAIHFKEFGLDWKISAEGLGLAVLVVLSLLGGFVLNFTPCVLPVIPLKIMGLAQHAGNPRRAMFMGAVMSVGVVAFWVAIGVLMVTLTQFKAISQLFQFPAFTIGVGVFILVMAVGMFGVFTVRLPQFVYFLDPKSDTVSGGFLFGVMTAVLATPCTAPFMGTASAWAVKQPPTLTLAVFASIGVGMAVPYLVLAAYPKLLARVPRSGPGSDAVKQVLGLMMVGVAVFFLGTGLDPLARLPVDEPIRWFWWVVFAFTAMAAGWMIVSVVRFSRSWPLRGLVMGMAGCLVGGGLVVTMRFTERSPIHWKGYTPERFEAALAAGKVVVIDFTAEWCLNCKTLENTVLHRPEIVSLLNGPGVAALKVDLTGKNPAGQAKLRDLNWVGIPLLAVFGPGRDVPVTYDWYTADMVVAAVEGARPRRAAAEGP